MASTKIHTGLVLTLIAMLCGEAMGQSSSCNSALVSLAPCLNYISGNANTPSTSCCSQLASVVQATPLCLCSVLNGGGSSLGITMNQTLALALPSACQVQTPPISQCKAASAPTPLASPPVDTSPTTPPTESSSGNTPEAGITPPASKAPSASGTGSKTVPSTTTGTSDGNSVKAPFQLTLLVLFFAYCGSPLTKF